MSMSGPRAWSQFGTPRWCSRARSPTKRAERVGEELEKLQHVGAQRELHVVTGLGTARNGLLVLPWKTTWGQASCVLSSPMAENLPPIAFWAVSTSGSHANGIEPRWVQAQRRWAPMECTAIGCRVALLVPWATRFFRRRGQDRGGDPSRSENDVTLRATCSSICRQVAQTPR